MDETKRRKKPYILLNNNFLFKKHLKKCNKLMINQIYIHRKNLQLQKHSSVVWCKLKISCKRWNMQQFKKSYLGCCLHWLPKLGIIVVWWSSINFPNNVGRKWSCQRKSSFLGIIWLIQCCWSSIHHGSHGVRSIYRSRYEFRYRHSSKNLLPRRTIVYDSNHMRCNSDSSKRFCLQLCWLELHGLC